MPFHFVFIGDRLGVSGDPLHVDSVSFGDEVVTNNDSAAASIQTMLLCNVLADGSNDDKRCLQLNVTGLTLDVLLRHRLNQAKIGRRAVWKNTRQTGITQPELALYESAEQAAIVVKYR